MLTSARLPKIFQKIGIFAPIWEKNILRWAMEFLIHFKCFKIIMLILLVKIYKKVGFEKSIFSKFEGVG